MVKRMQKLKLVKKPLLKDAEGELSEWAKKQLAISRATPDSEAVPLSEVKKRLKL
jgi:hypothetical protein